MLARDADSGELVWAYNVTPQDGWDLDEPSAGIIMDLQIGGRLRKTLVHPARNGFYLRFRSRDGRDDPEALAVRLQRSHQGRRHGDRPSPLRYPEDHVHEARGSAEVCGGREGHHRDVVSRDRRQKLVPGRLLSANRPCLHAGRRTNAERKRSSTESTCRRPTTRCKETINPSPLAPGATNAGELQANDPVTGKTVWRVPWKVANNVAV